MSLLEGFETMRLVKVGPSLKERLGRWIAKQHHKAVIDRLRSLREGVERDMQPESWTALEAPMVLLLADVCDALSLDEAERAQLAAWARGPGADERRDSQWDTMERG